MIYYLIGAIAGLYGVWWFFTVGGRYPLFYGPKWHDEQERLRKQQQKNYDIQEERKRRDLAKKIAEEMKK